MKNLTKICLTLLLFWLGSFGLANAQVLFYDNFENVTATDWPNPVNDADPVALIGTWGIGEDPNEGIQVINNLDPIPYNGLNYLSHHRWKSGDDSGGVDLRAEFTQDATGRLVVDFGFYNGGGEHWIYLANNVNDNDTLVGFLKMSATGTIKNNPDPNELAYSMNEWHDLRLDLDFNSKTFDLYLDGVKSNVTYAFNVNSNAVNTIVFYNYPSSFPSHLYLDNVRAEMGDPQCTLPMPADLNGDCRVDMVDFARLAARWLECNLSSEAACMQ